VKIRAFLPVLFLAFVFFAGCFNSPSKNKLPEVRIAATYGLGVAPAYVIADLKLIEKYHPNVKVTFKRYGSSVALRNAVVEGSVDIMFSSIITPITLKDTGLNFKIASGVGFAPYELMVGDSFGIQTLNDFTSQNRIVLPGYGSIPHLTMYMAFDNQSGEMDNISSILQTMADPIGYESLLSGDVTAHFTTFPYTAKERAKGFHSILSSRDLLGDISFVASISEDFRYKHPEIYAAFYAALAEAVELINTRDEAALEIILKTEEISKKELLETLEQNGVIFTTKIYDPMQIAQLLHRFGFISELPVNVQDFMWESASSMLGKEWDVVFVPKKEKEVEDAFESGVPEEDFEEENIEEVPEVLEEN
jgi:NitT/TauT family transport system substrate-binding protein